MRAQVLMNGRALFFASVSVFSCSAQVPLGQGKSEDDLAITERLRRGLMEHEALSFDAKNVKVITQAGRVTLRGAVKNAKELVDIERVALKTAGSGNVDSQLEVLP